MLAKLKLKYANMSLQAKAAVWFTLCTFMQRGITMITTPFFTRLMPLDQYGAVSTFQAWQSVLSLVCTLTLYKALMNLYVRRSDWERVLSSVTSLSVLSASVWLVVSLLFVDQFSGFLGMSKVLTVALFAMLVGQAVMDCWSLHQRYRYSYKAMVGVTLLLTALSSFIGLAGVVFVEPTAEARLVPLAAVTIIVGVALYIGVLRRGGCAFDKGAWLFALSFCIPLMPHYLSEFVLNSSDRLVINYLCGSGDVALYAVASSVSGLVGIITSAINASYAPYTYQKISSGETEELGHTTNVVLIAVVVTLLAIELFGTEIVWVFGGSQYLESATLIVPLCFGMYFSYLFQMFARVQEYYVRRMAVVIPSVLCAILNVVLNLALIPPFGYQAAAWTTAGCYFVFCLLHYAFYRGVCKEKGMDIYEVGGILAITLLFIALSVAAFILGRAPIVKYATIFVLVCAGIAMRGKLKTWLFELKTRLNSQE